MATQSSGRWIDGFAELHPLLAAPPEGESAAAPRPLATRAAASGSLPTTLKSRRWAARKAEIDAASRADAAGARLTRHAVARETERKYGNAFATWTGFVVVVGLILVGLFLVDRLIEESRLENCLLGYRHYCEQPDHR